RSSSRSVRQSAPGTSAWMHRGGRPCMNAPAFTTDGWRDTVMIPPSGWRSRGDTPRLLGAGPRTVFSVRCSGKTFAVGRIDRTPKTEHRTPASAASARTLDSTTHLLDLPILQVDSSTAAEELDHGDELVPVAAPDHGPGDPRQRAGDDADRSADGHH